MILNQKFLTLALSTIALILTPQVLAQKNEDIELLKFCGKFPQNGKCEGIEAPIALKDRDGSKAECELRWSNAIQGDNCKYLVQGDTLIIYYEVGEKTEVLDEQRATQEIKITPENFMFFPTAKHYQWKKNLLGKPKLVSNYDIFFKIEPDSESTNRSNRLSIYLEHKVRDEEKASRQAFINFLKANHHLNTDQKSIVSKIQELQTSSSKMKGEKAIKHLLDTQSCIRCDLSGADLIGADLKNVNLEGANLNNAMLTDANLSGAYLLGANLNNATLDNADLNFAELPYSSLTSANLQSAKLSGANLVGVNLANGNLSNTSVQEFTNLESANLANVNFQSAELSGVNLTNANLQSANFQESKISVGKASVNFGGWVGLYTWSTNFSNANLADANFIDVSAQGAIFNRVNLTNAKLSGIDLSATEISYGKRSKEFVSYLLNADLTNADLSNAKLNKAYFTEANLSGVILADSSMKQTQMSNVNLANSDLTNANLDKAYLGNADLSNATIENTRMTLINMNGSNLTGVNIVGADLDGSTFCKAKMPDGLVSDEGCQEE